MKFRKYNNCTKLSGDWNGLSNSFFHHISFLKYLERTNPCNQTYYTLSENSQLLAGAILYSSDVNVLSFTNHSLSMPMRIIGLPLASDKSGLLGDDKYAKILIEEILDHEKGIILCLNFTQEIQLEKIIEMRTLPSMILKNEYGSWSNYLSILRHPYRRRILKTLKYSNPIQSKKSTCSEFTKDHYYQYLSVLSRSKTKIETLNFDFFVNLPGQFILNSFYSQKELVFWHIALIDQESYFFLLGGLDYDQCNKYDSFLNNLTTIIKDGITANCAMINLGQTAEIAKARFGAVAEEKKLFLYHKNRIVRFIFRKFSSHLSYNRPLEINNVFKRKQVSKPIHQRQEEYV